ncbi:hypothetical protein [Candidatus Poriferisodalis sp.]|uniref:hypothetical protein n=1 Tax=Candidatus Poriferisodalis sp. TaxID=3101277 RepID=UPI003B5160C3
MADKLHAHLQMIQGVVTRLGHNSFLLKGWSVILIAALLAFAANTSESLILLVTLVPILAFWGLDGYYLWQERRYRALYNHVRTLNADDLEYDLDVNVSPDTQNVRWFRTVFSRTLVGFYGTILVTVVVIMVVSLAGGSDATPPCPADCPDTQ